MNAQAQKLLYHRWLIRSALNNGDLNRVRLEMHFVDAHQNKRLCGIPNIDLVKVYRTEIERYENRIEKRLTQKQ
jgi:hypothetical protein